MSTYMRRSRGESLYNRSEWMVVGAIRCGIVAGWLAFGWLVIVPLAKGIAGVVIKAVFG